MAALRSLELIRELIAFDTTSRESNLALIAHVRNYLDGFGIASRLVPDETGRKANLYATVGPDDRPGVMLSGHTDVVPVDGQDWSTDPFQLSEKDGRLYGRGACDMKSFIAIALSTVPKLVERKLAKPVHLAFSYDEEVGCIGVRPLIAMMNELPVKPEMCIVGEPTEMRIVIAHKGRKAVNVEVRGRESHSALTPSGVNAIEYAADLITYLRRMARHFAEEGPFDPAFDIPYTTVQTGVIRGGTALNIVPNHCRFEFEMRNVPGHDTEALYREVREHATREIEPAMKAVDPATGFAFAEQSHIEALNTAEDEPVVTFAKSLAGRNEHSSVAYGTEAGLFRTLGSVPAVVCGPGSIAQAHRPDEFIALEQVAACEAFLDRLVERLHAA